MLRLEGKVSHPLSFVFILTNSQCLPDVLVITTSVTARRWSVRKKIDAYTYIHHHHHWYGRTAHMNNNGDDFHMNDATRPVHDYIDI